MRVDLCYHFLVKEFRIIFLVFFAVVAARMLGEISSCPYNPLSLCSEGLVVFVPFLLSVYFFDSFLEEYLQKEEKKRIIINTLLVLPYFVYIVYVVMEFFSSLSIVSIEYIASANIIFMIAVFALIYWLNNQHHVRRLNTVFMATLLLSLLIFRFI